MSDTWSDIQALKSKQSSLREKMMRRKKEREGLVASITNDPGTLPAAISSSSSSASSTAQATSSTSSPTATTVTAAPPPESAAKSDPEVEKILLVTLCDVGLTLPIDSITLINSVSKTLDRDVPFTVVEDLLQKFAAQTLISIGSKEEENTRKKLLTVTTTDHAKLSAVANELGADVVMISRKRKKDSESQGEEDPPSKVRAKTADTAPQTEDSIESLLSMQSSKERENKKLNEEIMELLSAPTTKEQSLVERFKSVGGAQVREFCQYGTKEECYKLSASLPACQKLHFKKIIHKHTDESLGDCSFLNTCFHMDTCKYVHYEIDYPKGLAKPTHEVQIPKKCIDSKKEETTLLYPNQWVQCDLRIFDMSVLGKFSVVMADPPWDIHMELPYGTMSDDEMRALDIPSLQDDGFIFLWVTGRAMELGRECLKLWGYERVDEMIWVKTNQLQRIIRTGRTGHWLNHGKEHCLVGVKGCPKGVNRGLDCDVIVAEVRATSHKPDEIYGIIERLSPGTRKIELFGRPHNIQPNWITLGNQLDGVRLLEPEVVRNFKKIYPDGNCMKPPVKQLE